MSQGPSALVLLLDYHMQQMRIAGIGTGGAGGKNKTELEALVIISLHSGS